MSAREISTDASASRVRVAFVIQTFHPVVGGAERQLLGVLPTLKEQGIDALVVTRGLAGEPKSETINGVSVVRSGHYRRGAIGSIGFFFGALWHVARFRPDVTHAFSLMTPATVCGLYRWLTRTPMVLKALGGGSHGDCQRITEKPLYSLRRRLLQHSIDAAQVISDEIDAELANLGVPPARRFRVPNGVDVVRLSAPGLDLQAKNKIRNALAIPMSATVFVYVGRLVPGKFVDGLIKAFIEVFANDPDTWLLVAGEGPEREALEMLATSCDRVRVLGACEEVPELLAASSVFVLPSSAEGMSNSLLEAMAAGMPIVSTAVGAADELLGTGERGVLIPPDDTRALGDALRQVAQDPKRDEMGARAREYVEQRHGMSVVGSQLTAIYRKLTSRESHTSESSPGLR